MQSYIDQYNLPVTPFDLPADIPQPVAYYGLDEGAGFDLKESVTGVINAGSVIYDADHQTVNYAEPNWMEDENFDDYQREQFFGHGDPSRSTPSRNQVHWQFEQ